MTGYMIRRKYYVPENEYCRYYGPEEDLHAKNVILPVDYNEVSDGTETEIDASFPRRYGTEDGTEGPDCPLRRPASGRYREYGLLLEQPRTDE